MAKGKIGLLPLYLKLYDDVSQASRPRMEAFTKDIVRAIEKRGIQVVASPICRIQPEFEAAVTSLETAGVDAIVTLHLAYSPSLESSGALASTRLPILVLDTTPTWSYGPAQDPSELMFNHGIHGVQDMCNLLLRNGKGFAIEAGHWERSDVIDRLLARLPAARAASIMGRGRVGLIGSSFHGMGDFATSPEKLFATVGGSVRSFDPKTLPGLMASVSPADIKAELAEDAKTFVGEALGGEAHHLSVHLGLALRGWLRDEGIAAFTCNFLDMERKLGYPTVPFLEASKAMARGTGYAGEGDVLTALFCAAVASIHAETSFTEMFCPDWEGGRLFLSHMGEMNWRLAEGKAELREMDYKYSDAANPAFLTGRFKAGDIVLANLAPLAGDRYRLILAPAAMLPVTSGDRMEKSIRGWFKPARALPDFLAEYSRQGGTHHLALAYTTSLVELRDFAKLMGWEIAEIG
jgi:L-arabinose isomerase